MQQEKSSLPDLGLQKQKSDIKEQGNTKAKALLHNFKYVVDTRSYKEHMLEIVNSISSLDQFTNNLQAKVDNLLKAQQNQFVGAYMLHMKRIEEEFNKMQNRIKQYQAKIEYYENEGRLSALIKKVHKLENEAVFIYSALSQKQKMIKNQSIEITVLKGQLKRAEKELKRFKNSYILQTQNNEIDKPLLMKSNIKAISTTSKKTPLKEDYQFSAIGFPTQISNDKSFFREVTSEKRKLPHPSSTNNVSEFKLQSSYQTQLKQLKNKNKRLTQQSSQIYTKKLQMEGFLIKVIEDIKRNICIRKKMNKCSYEDFCKEDKINLLLKIISNQQILVHLYQKIFKQQKPSSGYRLQVSKSLKTQQIARNQRILPIIPNK